MSLSTLTFVEQAPAGLIFRPARLEDCAAVVDLLNVCARELSGVDEFSVDGLSGEWTQPGFDLARSSLVAIHGDDHIVGYTDIWDMQDPPVKPFSFGRVHPDFRGQGIGTVLLSWAEERSRQAVDRVPAGASVAMVAAADYNHADTVQLLTHSGFYPKRYSLEMTIDLPATPSAVPLPQGIHLLTKDQFDDLRAVYAAYRDAWQDHRGYVAQDEEKGFSLWQHRWTTDPDYDPSLWFLAFDGAEIAGVALCKRLITEDPDLGWVETLAVRRPWRRRGVGLALLQAAFAEFVRRGLKRGGLGVDANSLTGATRLYERAGMQIKSEHTIFEKELRPGIDLSRQSVESGE